MISFRYHVVSLIAVFLAVALGIVIGTTALNGPITSDLRKQLKTAQDNSNSLTNKANALQTQANQAQSFATTFGGNIIKGSLTGQKVLMIGLPGADSAVETALVNQVGLAGGTMAGRLQLTGDYVDPKRSSDLTQLAITAHPVGQTAPQSDDAGTVSEALLSFVLVGKAKPADTAAVLQAYVSQGFLNEEKDPIPTTLVLVVAHGQPPANDLAGRTERFALITQLQLAGGQLVVVGDPTTAEKGGVVSLVRSSDAAKNTVSTVDNVDTPVGQISAMLALNQIVAGTAGHYGTGQGATKPFPVPTQ